ncbi:putative tRNA (cytidine(34)-2'-O)-methyltransferase [Bacteriovorax sp. BSW11_IV]|uniref:tRNA (cytidine(34)-2'-O)-methyltransferase n=1 Tax=Bacteriovorax sp. BSW11_IV TaxID=1353529 RepID=UPI000389EED2|nr:tRNA (cytidine(34)-2'-O)-methyltransferase [Bacteriovorax sp. BSW11_IV]EQC45874.1 putative tRNA (cytidine(34)-2'-O)-methyltransferase [Bacteriovorax sp. BSW11_IV]
MSNDTRFNIVLYSPEIPGNTGSIGRTCVALNLRLIIIHPIAFDLSEKAVRRAGLDYWKYVEIVEYKNWDEFITNESPDNLIFFSRFKQQSPYYEAPYKENCYLVFGSETKGLPEDILERFATKTYALPMFSEHIRSLNLANAATSAAYEALRQIYYK